MTKSKFFWLNKNFSVYFLNNKELVRRKCNEIERHLYREKLEKETKNK